MNHCHRRVIAQCAAAVVVSFGMLAVLAQASWKDKDWRQWSKDDCAAIAKDSPWAQFYYVGTPGMVDLHGPANPTGACIVAFRSALPIRESAARLSQLDQNYKKMSPEERQAFDQKMDADLAASYADRIVIGVRYSASVALNPKFTPDPPEAAMFVLASGSVLKPSSVHWITQPTGNPTNPVLEFELTYPRTVNGQPVINPADKKLIFAYGSNYGRQQLAFDPSKMMYKGKFEY